MSIHEKPNSRLQHASFSRRQVLGATAVAVPVLAAVRPASAQPLSPTAVVVDGQARAAIVLPQGADIGETPAPIELTVAEGAITAPMQVVEGDIAGSAGSWVESPVYMSGAVQLSFEITVPRTYQFEGLVYAPDFASDSFFVQVDTRQELEWHLGDKVEDHGLWHWIPVTGRPGGDKVITVDLQPGTHTVTFRGRDKGARLSALRVVAEAAGATQLGTAVDSLVSYVEQATGAALPVVSAQDADDPSLPAGRIYVGWAGPHEAVVASAMARLDGDGFVIHSTGDDLCLVGPSDWGTRFAVYEFLERHAGVRWLMPGEHGEDVPARDTITVPVGTDRQQPSFLGRTLSYWFESNTPVAKDWASDDPQVQFATRQRTHSRVTNVGNHNLYAIFPTRVYGDPTKSTYRPELYPIVNGQTKLPALGSTSSWQPRFDIQATVDVAIAYVIKYFDENPDMPIVSLGVNDGLGHSETDIDPDIINSVGRPSASRSYYTWVNSVVEGVLATRPDFADKRFPLLAYNQVIDPPDFPLHPNVIPLVTKESHLWDDKQGQRDVRALFNGWHAKASSWALYDYSSGARFLVPRSYNTTLQEAYRYGHQLGMRYSYADMVPAVGEGPKNWVLGKLMWNVDVNVEALTQEWCERAVGTRAAPYLRTYFRIWEQFWEGTARDTGFWEFSRPRIYLYFILSDYLGKVRAADVQRARDLLEATIAHAETPAQRARAEVIMETFRYYEAGCLSYPMPVGAPDSTAQALKLAADMRRTLPDRVAMASERLVIEAQQEADPVIRGRVNHRRYQHTWTGYNGDQLWHLVDHLRANNPHGGTLARRLDAQVLAGNAADPDVRVAKLALRIARDEAPQLAPNGSFDDGGADAPPWRLVGDIERVSNGGFDSGPCLRLPVMSEVGLANRDQTLILPIPSAPGLLTFRMRFKVNKKVRNGQVSVKINLWTKESSDIFAYQQPMRLLSETRGSWAWISLCEDIPAEALNRAVGQVRLVASVLGYDGVGDALLDDIEVYSENESLV